ncbi:FtsK/SpoIIIE domain-containing protein [Paenibacillus shunpengii]|uniref:FtsK/SpoIIIE domain-containing protein n=1 Tax=Paenibacillus shunpengii TaxID=2054424 RepID=A0ABW5ST85_9BACL
MLTLGISLLVGSVGTLIHNLSFSSSFSFRKHFPVACRTLGLSVTHGNEIALPSVNKVINESWGVRLLVGLPVGLSSAKVIDHKDAIAEALRVPADSVEMRYANDGLIVDIVTQQMPTRLPYKAPDDPDSYRVLIGVNQRNEPRYYDFDGSYPHLLIGGISGGGKSVILRSILTTLVSGPAPDLYLCDLKGGVELGIFRRLACVKGFGTTIEDVRRLAAELEAEMLRRYAILAENGAQSWTGKKAILVIDELADFKSRAGDPDAKVKAEIKAIIARISAKGRAAGVLLVLATQRPSADVVDGMIKTNIAASICFRTRDTTQSRIILDSPAAADLPDIPGRLIFQTAYDETLQAPFLSAEEARRLIADLPQRQHEEVVQNEPHINQADAMDCDIIEL